MKAWPVCWTLAFGARDTETPKFHPIPSDAFGWGTRSGPSSIRSHLGVHFACVSQSRTNECGGGSSLLMGRLTPQATEDSVSTWWQSLWGVCAKCINPSVMVHESHFPVVPWAVYCMMTGSSSHEERGQQGAICHFLCRSPEIFIIVRNIREITSAV